MENQFYTYVENYVLYYDNFFFSLRVSILLNTLLLITKKSLVGEKERHPSDTCQQTVAEDGDS